jgi:antitoxin component YwqK of YwqJK toxin-antitoxin module
MNYYCAICFEEFPENNILKYCNDQHTFCKTCFHNLIQHVLNEDIDNQTFLCPLCRNENEFSKNGWITTYFENSENIKIHTHYINNKLHGLYEEYYENGTKASQFYIYNGLIEGERIEWYDNGNIWLKCNYINGKKEGISYEYYENGQLWKEITYQNGIRLNG